MKNFFTMKMLAIFLSAAVAVTSVGAGGRTHRRTGENAGRGRSRGRAGRGSQRAVAGGHLHGEESEKQGRHCRGVCKDNKSGNTLYVDSNAQTVATLKNYAFHDKFYTSPKYTGWQTLNGKVYYYNSDHTPLTGNQVIGGVMYTFASDGSLSQSSGTREINVSKYQGNIDWGTVASSGISFAIIRAGYRGSSTGVLVEDPYFKKILREPQRPESRWAFISSPRPLPRRKRWRRPAWPCPWHRATA